MGRVVLWVIFVFFIITGSDGLPDDLLCGEEQSHRAQACVNQILGTDHTNNISCSIDIPYPVNSLGCKSMSFGPLESNSYIGRVILRPYMMVDEKASYTVNRAVLNITFANIKWKTMKFRFQLKSNTSNKNHCRNIVLSNDVTINDRSVLYYNCYWPTVDRNITGDSHLLDFEATDDKVVNRGQYYFNIPSMLMLNTSVTEEQWVPFLYIEILKAEYMRLHINPPMPHLNISGYQIKVMKKADQGTQVEKVTTLTLKNHTDDMTYDYSLLYNGTYHFVVTPLHAKCMLKGAVGERCSSVESPKIVTNSDGHEYICIASITAVVVAILFVLYLVLKFTRRRWCRDYTRASTEVPPPTKVLVINSPDNNLHIGCVTSFVSVLRSGYGFDVMYAGDIMNTKHRDPLIWTDTAFQQASHIIYVVGTKDKANYDSIFCDKPLPNNLRHVDTLLLNKLSLPNSKKDVVNVFFDHSDADLPIATKHARPFFLIKDWQQLIAHLSKNVLPRQEIMRTDQGKGFLQDLATAKKLLNEHKQNILA